jgi:hypothetical protein
LYEVTTTSISRAYVVAYGPLRPGSTSSTSTRCTVPSATLDDVIVVAGQSDAVP